MKTRGFTIVELLIVIVIIAILASITVVAYSGIRERARGSALSSELAQIAKAVEVFKATSPTGQYPASLAAVKGVNENTPNLNYFYNQTNNVYCLDKTEGAITRSIGPKSGQREGRCALNGLVVWMPFNGTVAESVSNAAMTLTGTQTYTTGAGNTANGAYISTSSNLISLNNASIPSNPSQVTISVWAKGVSNSTGDFSYLFHRGKDNAIGSSVYWMGVRDNGNFSASIDGTYTSGDSGTAASSSAWRHIVMTFNGSEQRVYVDGQLKRSYAVSLTNQTTANTLTIGAGGSSNYRSFNGAIDDLRVYSRPLTETEVANLYDVGAY